MRFSKALCVGIVAAGMVALPLSSASAGWRHHGHVGLIGGLFGFAGGVVVGAATIATAPIAIIAGAGQGGYEGPPPPAYAPPAYGPQQAYAPHQAYAPPPGSYYGPPRGYYQQAPYGQPAYGPPAYGPPAYGPAPQYNAPPQGYYGPPPGY
jgi:hypothetical protein